MPTYEYRCHGCGKKFERFQKITDPVIGICPFCGGETERLISGGSGLLFKGSGFYITDYRSDSYKKAASKEESPEPKVSTDSSSKKKPPTEKKPSGD